jgi:hypothetical protein
MLATDILFFRGWIELATQKPYSPNDSRGCDAEIPAVTV